jgi:hypothetical protein
MCIEFGYEWRHLPEEERNARLRRAAERMLGRPAQPPTRAPQPQSDPSGPAPAPAPA